MFAKWMNEQTFLNSVTFTFSLSLFWIASCFSQKSPPCVLISIGEKVEVTTESLICHNHFTFPHGIPWLFANTYLPPLCPELLKCKNQIFSLNFRDLWQSLIHRKQRRVSKQGREGVGKWINKCCEKINAQMNRAKWKLIIFEEQLWEVLHQLKWVKRGLFWALRNNKTYWI